MAYVNSPPVGGASVHQRTVARVLRGSAFNHQWYVGVVLLAGIAAAVSGEQVWGGTWGLTPVAIILIAFALAALTRAFPLKVSPQVEASLFGAPIFLAAVHLSPLQAALVAGAGSLAADLWLRRPRLVCAFNVGVSLLAVSLASLVFHGLAGDASDGLLDPADLAIGGVAAAVLQGVNLFAMVGLVSLRKGLSFWAVWRRPWLLDLAQECGSLAFGYLGAALVAEAWWSITLLIAPLILAHVALHHSVKEAKRNVELNQQLKAQMEELRSAQEQLIQSAKMASIGTLAAGIAHEINNPLFVVIGRVELLLRHKDRHLRTEHAKQHLATVHEQGLRAAQIVKGMLAFSSAGSPAEKVRLGDVVDKAVSLVGKGLGANVHINKEFASDLPEVDGLSDRLQQVFVNLLQNAGDAMPGGGHVYVRCWVEDGYVRASVKDTGVGISPEHQSRLFEPFFTTKEVGQGTGLGLFVCHRIVTEHHGRIKVLSEPGRGTEVVVELPVAQVAASERVKIATGV